MISDPYRLIQLTLSCTNTLIFDDYYDWCIFLN
jgi:hypothetical protein